ncbi:hypothetical protein Hypma_000467 [Hypsizygus marmoreus]|uniref:F-box domain-containing protein n=1 Tax=Hypsizygus marmoreus TaxID=39966 RepID=A0A369J7T4_HYPMA|nr:hypothetical protein Hypma_000467 [Hypsizygus marmoreus]
MAQDLARSIDIPDVDHSSIHSLSNEVLSLIFVEACYDDYLTRLDHQPRTCTALSIGLVCGSWRQIMLSGANDHCWASFIVSDADVIRQRNLIPLLMLYLERSGVKPLHVKAYLEHCHEDSPILPLIMEHSSRWERVTLAVPSWTSLIFEEARPLPRLVHVDFGFRDTRYLHIRLLCFSEAQNIRTLTLRNICKANLIIPESNQITQYTSERSSIAGSLRNADGMEDLEELEFLSPYDSDEQSAGYNIIHPSLRLIRLTQEANKDASPRYKSRDVLRQMIGGLTVPALQHLYIDLECWHTEPRALSAWNRKAVIWPHSEFLAFVQRSELRWTLEYLHLSNVNFTAQQLVDCLEALPGVRELDLDEPPGFESAVLVKWLTRYEALAEPWAAECTREPCPRAPRLDYLGIGGKLDVRDDDLVMMVESRMEHSEMAAKWDESSRERGEDEDVYTPELELMHVDFMFRYRVMDEEARVRLYALNQPDHPRFIRVSKDWDDS